MSILAMANCALARRVDIVPDHTFPEGLKGIARAAATPLATQPGEVPGQRADQIDTALHMLSGYIPTEILTLYVAVVAALHVPNHPSTPTEWSAFWAFLVATPIVVWLVYAAKCKALGEHLPFNFRVWPLWEMIAATVAYCAWAMALPDTPFTTIPWYSSALSGIVVLVASTVLGLLAPLFQAPLKAT
jgi:hypothetical protein